VTFTAGVENLPSRRAHRISGAGEIALEKRTELQHIHTQANLDLTQFAAKNYGNPATQNFPPSWQRCKKFAMTLGSRLSPITRNFSTIFSTLSWPEFSSFVIAIIY